MTTIATNSYYGAGNQYSSALGTSSSSGDSQFSDVIANQDTENQIPESDSSGAGSSSNIKSSNVMLELQGKLTLLPVDMSSIKAINIAELPEDQYQIHLQQQRDMIAANKQYLESQHRQYSEPDLSNYTGTQAYATITVDGQVVATIDNQGVVATQSDALNSKFKYILIDQVNGTNGPNLAQARADQIAEVIGGKITKASTAITQSQFELLSSREITVTVDYAAMASDPAYADLQKSYENYVSIQQRRAEYLARQQLMN